MYKTELFFICKKIRMIYTLDLIDQTWRRDSTESGLFDGQPDQMQRLLDDDRDMLYFTEESGESGIHARDKDSRYYTILEATGIPGETSGLALSPNGKYMYVALQDSGKLFSVFRKDGKAFDAEHLDIRYHKS